MSITAAQLLVRVNAETAGAEAQIAGLARSIGPAGALMLGLGGAGLAMAAVGGIAAHMAGDFQAGIVSLATGAGESTSNLKMVSAGILQLAKDTGTSTQQLVAGMYMIESGGFHGKAGLDILTKAAEGAKVGNADLGIVADATDTILKNYGESGLTAAQAVNTLIATVAHGKTHLGEFSDSLAQVLPTAANAGISLNDVMGAMATMTGQGTHAAEAATYLRQTIVALSAPGKLARTTLESVGLTAKGVADEMHKSLPLAIQEITDAVGKKFPKGSAGYVAAIREIAGGMRQMQGLLQLGGDHVKTFAFLTGQIAGQVKKGGSSVEGWNLVQTTFNQKLDKAKEVVETLFIQLGTKLLPVLGRLVDSFAKNLPGAVQGISNAFKFLHDNSTLLLPVFGAVAGLIAGVMVPALIAMAAAAWAALAPALVIAAPFIAVGLAIGAVALIIKHFYDTSAPFRAALAEIGHALAPLRDAFGQIGPAIGQVQAFLAPFMRTISAQVTPIFQQLGGQLKAELLPAWKSLQQAFVLAEPALKVIGIIIGVTLVAAFGILLSIFTGVVVGLATFIAGFARAIGGIIQAVSGAIKLIIDFFAGLFTILGDIFTGNWTKFRADANAWGMGMWSDLVQIFTGLWNAAQGIWQASIGAISSLVITFVKTVVGFFEGLWDQLTRHSIIPDMVNDIVSWFQQLPSRALSAVQGLASQLVSFFGGLAVQALVWGANLMQGFTKGIKGAVGGVQNAISNAVTGVKNFLGFHSPAKEGPGADADTWAPNLMRMFASGLTASIPALARSASQAMAAIEHEFTRGATARLGVNGIGGAVGAPALTALAMSPAAQVTQAMAASNPGGGNGNASATLVLDGKALARAVWPYLGREARLATGVRS